MICPRLIIVWVALYALPILSLVSSCNRPHSYFIVQYAGNILGEFEACGCDKKSLGGIEKLGGFLDDKMQDDHYIFLVAGNTFFPSFLIVPELREHFRLKALLLSESLSLINPTAVLVGKKDLALGIDFLNEFGYERGLKLLSSNLKSRRYELLFMPYIIKEFSDLRVGIFGLTGDIEHLRFDTDPESKQKKGDILRANPLESSRHTVSELKQIGVEFIILLSDLAEEDERNILRQEKDIDLIISTGSGFPTDEPVSLNKQILVRPFSRLQYIGEIEFRVHGKRAKYAYENFPMIQQIPTHPKLQKLAEQTSAALDFQMENDRYLLRRNIVYAGADSCQDCHKKEYEFWETTGHSQAYSTLLKEGKSLNMDCVSCHNTGAPAAGYLKNVQCEACHGEGRRHIQNSQSKTFPINEETCLKCHDPDKFNDFVYEEKIKIVECITNKL